MVRALAGDSTMMSGLDTEEGILSGLLRSQDIGEKHPAPVANELSQLGGKCRAREGIDGAGSFPTPRRCRSRKP